MGATDDLARFAASLTLSQIPESACEAAKSAIVDVIACALAGRDERVARNARQWVISEGGAPVAAIWGTTARASPSRAAFANGTAAHCLDYDDVNWAMNGHPSTVLVPAVLAALESHRGRGSDLLLGYIAGLEVAGRIGEMAGRVHYDTGWHPTATLGTLGATAAVAKVFGIDASALKTAFGIAVSTVSGSRMNFGTDTKPLHAGLAAERALVAVELTRRGVTARQDGLEASMGFLDLYARGEHPVARTALEPLVLVEPGIELKPYPSCRFTHRVIDAVRALRARHPQDDPEKIECTVDPFCRKILIYPTPRTGLEAKFSMPYCTAIAWIDGATRLASFADERIVRNDVKSLASRVHVHDGRPEEETVTIIFRDGTSDAESRTFPLGHPANPMSEAQRLDKVKSCAEPVIGTVATARLIETVRSLEDLGDVRELSRVLAPAT